ncbi:PQQ-dependent sugar dehydrogenase [Thioalkalivibrio sp. HK1]|uniref:PQQ-dependent sugar dehydrogenase n=1 Tax=Thioalkalivibrio sp. HK1 TaxID=1469245 RepID=UPI001E3BE4FD|nr:PQQ-dependent sugar dehydrogenase [Thioalkalivibrio sp. HK1]
MLTSLGLVTCVQAQGYRLEVIAQGFDLPWSVAFLPGGDMLITELSGTLHLVRDEKRIDEPIAGVPPAYFAGQGGLMDVVLHPKHAENRLVYLSLAAGDRRRNHTRIVRGTLDLDGMRLLDVETVFDALPEKDTAVHYGARMAFLGDGTLLISIGDGFDFREEAQNIGNHLGTMVRITDTGEVPKDNPFIGLSGARPEIYSYGHRNPQGVFYDAKSGRIFQIEHGARGGDELNLIEPGVNYGWPITTWGIDYSGARISPYTTYPGTAQPLHHWTPSIAPSGMTIYRGAAFPEWTGDIFVTSLVFRKVVRLDMDKTEVSGTEDLFAEIDARIRDVRTGPDGLIYILSEPAGDESGKIWRVLPADSN